MTGRLLDRRRRKVRIPIGIEKLLCAAAADPAFCEHLVMARAAALEGTGLEISASEAMILKAVPEAQLRTMIENIDLKRHKRRRFFRGIAAASLAATTVMGTTECNDGVAAGIDPEWDTKESVDTVDTLDGDAEQGMLADDFAPPPDTTVVGSDTVEIDDVNVSAGIPPQDVTED